MKRVDTEIEGVFEIEPRVFEDERGDFMETCHAHKLAALGLERDFLQDNQSYSTAGTLRGLHYQIGDHPQGKLVRVVSGEVWDVAVDMRRGSPTFGRWVARLLSERNRRMLWIPEGFAHGFYVTGESAVLLYKCTDVYAPEEERTVRWDDPELGIDWPIGPGQAPKLSDKDRRGVAFADADCFP